MSFTGGDTGISICKKGGMTPYQMELGGKDACIVCADADLDLAAKNIVKVSVSQSPSQSQAPGMITEFIIGRLLNETPKTKTFV